MIKACDEHKKNPVMGYHSCAGCEIQMYKSERDALQQLLNARDEEVEGLRKASSEIADALHQMTIRAIAAEELIDVCDCSNISEPTPVECHHEWIDDGLHIEVCVLCGKEENFEEKPENQA